MYEPPGEPDVLKEAALLLKRVRQGGLCFEQLELAACLGYPAARQALGEEAPRRMNDLKRWGKRLDGFGPAVSYRMIIAAAKVLLPLLEAKGIAYAESRTAIAAGESFLADPSEERRETAQIAYTQAIAAAVRTDSDGTETAALIAAFAAHAATSPVPATDLVADAADVTSEEALRAAVQEGLIPWVLSEDWESGEG